MLDSFAAYVLPDLMAARALDPQPDLPGDVDIYRTFPTRDGYVTGIVIQDSQFEGFCRAIEREDLLESPDYRTIVDRILRADQLFELCAGELAKLSTDEFIERARRFGAPFAPAQTVEDFLEDPQVKHSGVHFDIEDPLGGSTRMLRHPVRYGESPASLRRHPPRIGEHTDEILAAAGLDAEAVARLREEGAVG
jgi:crotonobetainyl-CoA:carnitine CoA-transferase CaiB-like acyl-CoA transferase